MGFHENLTEARKRANLTQQEVANHLGVQKKQVYRWEKGQQEMGVYKFNEICALYKVSADYLLGLSAQAENGVST